MNLYRLVAEKVGTPEARDLADQLMEWHDAMVKHLRALERPGAGPCEDGCPHDAARYLWSAALAVFGEHAHRLAFLRTHGGPPPSAASSSSELRT